MATIMAAKKKTGAQLQREINAALGGPPGRPGRVAVPARPAGQDDYERRERDEAQRQLQEIRRAPLSDRKEAQASFLEAMRDPEIVRERIGWLLDGNYGYGSMLLARQILQSPRMNRVAALTQMVGAFEWQSPEDMSRAAWKKLTTAEQSNLDRAVQAAIFDAADAE